MSLNRLTDNFYLEEFLASQTAVRKGIDNSPKTDFVQSNIFYTARKLQKIRNRLCLAFDRDIGIYISSGYRCLKLNRILGGSKTSSHVKGWAADINAQGMTAEELFLFIVNIKDDLNFDQLIFEFGRWVHIGFSNTPRGQILVAKKVKRKYLPGYRTVYEEFKYV